MTCPQCRTDTLPGARYCHRCGRALSSGNRSPFPPWKRRTMALILSLSALFTMGMLLIPRKDNSLQVGDPAPTFEAVSLAGEQVSLADLRGKPLVLNFWGTWCRPCRQEMPAFADVYSRYSDQGLQFLAVNAGEPALTVELFLRQLGVAVPVLLDPDGHIQDAYRIIPLPTTFFIDRSGVIRAIYPYQMTRLQMEAEVRRLLSIDSEDGTSPEGGSVWDRPTF